MNVKGLMQVFISIYSSGILIHTIGITVDASGQRPHWLRQYERYGTLQQLDPLVAELEQRGFVKQPSTGYLLIYAKLVDATVLPERAAS